MVMVDDDVVTHAVELLRDPDEGEHQVLQESAERVRERLAAQLGSAREHLAAQLGSVREHLAAQAEVPGSDDVHVVRRDVDVQGLATPERRYHQTRVRSGVSLDEVWSAERRARGEIAWRAPR